jgi:glyoxylase-like metal-dependent hydrolase (beta-lactamase superfamily II)
MLEADVAPGIHRVEDAYTNFYLVEEDARLTVVDAGVRSSWESLHAALERLGRRSGDVAAVILTHAHFDHVGFAERARRELGVPVWVHENDWPLARHPLQYGHERSRLPYLAHLGSLPIMASLLTNGAFWPHGVRDPRRFADGALDVPGSPSVVFTPGHTLGHCAFHFERHGALIAGDAIVMLDPYTGRRGPCLVSRAATADSERALRSLDALEATGAQTVLTGHGPAWRDGIAEACRRARAAGVT